MTKKHFISLAAIFRDECASILRKIAEDIEHGRREGKIMDTNGNRVGKWSLS